MGAAGSKTSGGTLKGTYVPPTSHITESNLPKIITKDFRATVPPLGRKTRISASKMMVLVRGQEVIIDIPPGKRAGDRFTFSQTIYELDKVIASTLPMVPGMEIVSSKPIIYGSVVEYYHSLEQSSADNYVGKVLQAAQTEVLKQVIEAKCNACLGMAFNVSSSTSGEYGNQRSIIVTAYGTPCVVLPLVQQHSVVVADAVVETLTTQADDF
mmetsp:Transcript_13605/g.20557  ORF Transcript_13605/g.20557 Transcript_13605/m.20557 type:complete len:212 (-) Transcript_13605:148-783(-)|eukprot:CAMPEP_0118697526 /NCGR_PEP_ID=MMETSP0800-20121206/14575_1 /TAXON_ID=210618 ORGANISM="Striatella unipunctata, Strain CCMP2910" /NCGR_SAMPLE_ID=MMETSP0800 /ASSEMBLY_ACC=CAM_ASM_000638 /LENGTH=211 /DNA_ID=CAMNT_0006597007 /DNA_START=487 /DNA_END=1122 /DNA_ORIENTATION=+